MIKYIKFFNFQSLYTKRPFTELAVVNDEKTETSSGNGISEESSQYPGETQDVQSEWGLRQTPQESMYFYFKNKIFNNLNINKLILIFFITKKINSLK